jgi:hypothetical protein
MTTNAARDNKVLLEQLVKLTESIKRLAQDSENGKRDEEALRRQHVDFGYKVLGALMGRSRTAGFDIAVIDAQWDSSHTYLELSGLPKRAMLIELRSGVTSEVLYIDRAGPSGPKSSGEGDQAAEGQKPEGDVRRSGRDDQPPGGRVTPTTITSDREIDSLLVLEDRVGPPIAIGPRVKPPQRYQQT